jgi:hypothetical protein
MAAVAPAFMLTTERFAPSFSGRGAFPPVFRLSCAMGLIAGVYLVWERSSCRSTHPLPPCRFSVPPVKRGEILGRRYLTVVPRIVRLYGWTENNREVEMDMREMVDKVKKGEPLYGHSGLTPYMQGVAARNSRYSALMAQVLPWANFVNHNQVSGGTFALCRECLG